MFSMTTPLERVNENLLQARFQMERMRLSKTYQALELLDTDIKENMDEIYQLVHQARFISLTYIETLRNDRREKRQRYKINKKKKNGQSIDFV